jgi:hypothetical protein
LIKNARKPNGRTSLRKRGKNVEKGVELEANCGKFFSYKFGGTLLPDSASGHSFLFLEFRENKFQDEGDNFSVVAQQYLS